MIPRSIYIMLVKFGCGQTVMSKKGGYRQIHTHTKGHCSVIFSMLSYFTRFYVTKKIVKKKIIESSHQFLLFLCRLCVWLRFTPHI